MISRVGRRPSDKLSLDVGGSSHHSTCSRGRNRLASLKQQQKYHSPSPHDRKELASALDAGKAALEQYLKLQGTTKLPYVADAIQLNWEDVFVEDLLGVGGFASVSLVSCPKLRKRHNKTGNHIGELNSSMVSFDMSFASWNASEDGMSLDSEDFTDGYALKCLSTQTMSSEKQFVIGARDLVSEAFLLSRLDHPNVIPLYGVTGGNVEEAFIRKGGYFLVVEALDRTLNDDLRIWRGASKPSADDFLLNRSEKIYVPSIEERLTIAVGIAKGMEYLHSQNVLFRDLKPANVGFDRSGAVKLFDFGLAREVEDDHLPGIAGSMLYLAPEAILMQFNCKASDVYSYGILTWELASLLRPYPNFSDPEQLKHAVAIEGHRPDATAVTHPVHGLIESCWTFDYVTRPTFSEVLVILEEIRDSWSKSKRIKGVPSRDSPTK